MTFGITVGNARRTRSFVGENGSAVAGAEDRREADEDREPRPRDSSPLGMGRPRSNRENIRSRA